MPSSILDYSILDSSFYGGTSNGGRLVSATMIDTVMYTQAQQWTDGRRAWLITHNAEEGLWHLDVVGEPPESFEPAREKAFAWYDEEPGELAVDYAYSITADVAESVVGFRHDGPGRRELNWTPLEFNGVEGGQRIGDASGFRLEVNNDGQDPIDESDPTRARIHESWAEFVHGTGIFNVHRISDGSLLNTSFYDDVASFQVIDEAGIFTSDLFAPTAENFHRIIDDFLDGRNAELREEFELVEFKLPTGSQSQSQPKPAPAKPAPKKGFLSKLFGR